MTKAGIAEQTVHHALTGGRETVTQNPSLPEAKQEAPLTENDVPMKATSTALCRLQHRRKAEILLL